MTGRSPRRKLAVNRLREQPNLDHAAVDRFLEDNDVPIIEGDRATFVYRGEAEDVCLAHRVLGVHPDLPLRRLENTDLWYVVLELPTGSRVEYQYRVTYHGGDTEQVNDWRNPRVAHSPVGSSSVCHAYGYEVPDWTQPQKETRPGSIVHIDVPSRALRRTSSA